MIDPLLSVNRVAEAIGSSTRQVYELIESGEFPKPVKVGRSARWPESDVAAFIERKKQERDQAVAS